MYTEMLENALGNKVNKVDKKEDAASNQPSEKKEEKENNNLSNNLNHNQALQVRSFLDICLTYFVQLNCHQDRHV